MIEKIKHWFGLSRTFGMARSPKFAELSREMIKEAGGLCQMGLHKLTLLNPLNSHHVLEFHNFPDEEMKKSNLVVLCRFHHFLHAHLKNWASSNPNIREDCAILNEKIKNRP